MSNECFDCGHALEKKIGYSIEDPYVGRIETDGEYWHCPNCGTNEIPYETMQAVSLRRNKIIQEYLWTNIADADEFNEKYMQTHELAVLLGVSRQAICKSKIIVNLIYNVMIKGVRFWLRESAEKFKQNGDGRFPLVKRPMVDVVPKISGKGHASSKPKAQSVKQIQNA